MSKFLPPEVTAGFAAEIIGFQQSESMHMAQADATIDSMPNEDLVQRMGTLRSDLISYAESQGLRSLEDRVKRGLFTIGMVAIPEVRTLVEQLTQQLGARMKKEEPESTEEGVEDVILNIQRMGPWKYADAMTMDNPPAELKVWMMMNAVNAIDIPREKDLNAKEFL